MNKDFERIIKENFQSFLRDNGFLYQDNITFYRIIKNEIYQFISFQEAPKNQKVFMVDFGVNPLFIKKMPKLIQSFSLKPGSRLDWFIAENASNYRWFSYEDQTKLNDSIKLIKDIIRNKLFNWFDEYDNINDIITLYDQKAFTHPDNGWRDFDLMFIFYRLGEMEKVKEMCHKLMLNQREFIRETSKYLLECIKSDLMPEVILKAITEENTNGLNI